MTTFLESRPSFKRDFSTLVELLNYRAKQQSNQIAFTFLQNGEIEADRLTYHLLDQKARAIAARLQEVAKPGDRALLVYPSGLEFITAFFGCLYAGIIAVPAYPPRANQNLHRLQSIVSDAQANLALTTADLLPNLQKRWIEDPAIQPLLWVASNTVENQEAEIWQPMITSDDAIAFLQYTSGSTGKPKGVMVSHANLLHNERMIKAAFGHHEQTISVGWLPLFHDMGLVGNVLQPLYLGLPCTLMSPIDFLQKPVRWLQAISRYGATSSGGPNFAYDLCLRKVTQEQRQSLDLSRWEVAFSGAEPIRAETLEEFSRIFEDCGFRRAAFYPCYGMAEATLFITGGLKSKSPVIRSVAAEPLAHHQLVVVEEESPDAYKFVGCGQTWGNQKVIIVNPDTSIPCLPAQVGEIWVAGASVAQGYWNQPEQTKQTFRACLANTGEGSFLRTGDLGFMQNGELFVTGRLKDVIILRGRNHYPQDIELTVEKSHALIRKPGCCAAFEVNVAGEAQLVVVAEVERRWRNLMPQRSGLTADSVEQQFSGEQVLGDIRQAIAEQHELQVHAIVLLRAGSIPKTSSGKIQRHACRAGFLAHSLTTVAQWQEGTFQEQCAIEPDHPKRNPQLGVLQNWLKVQFARQYKLRPQDVDIHQPFSRYGLDSLQAVSIVALLEEELTCQLGADALETYPTIAALSQHLMPVIGSATSISQTSRIKFSLPFQQTLAHLFTKVRHALYQSWFHLECHGLENLPQDRSFLLAANHTSHLDAGAVMVALHEQVDQMFVLGAKDYFFDTLIKDWFFRTFFNLIPFDRHNNFLESLRECQQILDPAHPILIFPEGTRSLTGDLQPFQAGVGLLALKLKVPILPVYIEGTHEALPKGKRIPHRYAIRVVFGVCIDPADYHTKPEIQTERELCQVIAKDIEREVQRLKNH